MNKDIAMENQHDFCKGRFSPHRTMVVLCRESASMWVRETVALICLDFPKYFQYSPLPSYLRCHGRRGKVLAQIRINKKQEGTLHRR